MSDHLAERFDAMRDRMQREGLTELTEWEQGSEEEMLALYGPCSCGRAFRAGMTCAREGDSFTFMMGAACANGHEMG